MPDPHGTIRYSRLFNYSLHSLRLFIHSTVIMTIQCPNKKWTLTGKEIIVQGDQDTIECKQSEADATKYNWFLKEVELEKAACMEKSGLKDQRSKFTINFSRLRQAIRRDAQVPDRSCHLYTCHRQVHGTVRYGSRSMLTVSHENTVVNRYLPHCRLRDWALISSSARRATISSEFN